MHLLFVRRCLLVIVWPAPLACTPLGLWLYQDPAVTVARVRVGSDSISQAPVLVALDVQNPNDYTISTVRVKLSLELDDRPIGALDQATAMVLTKTATATVELPLTVKAGAPARRLTAIGVGTHHFVVVGRAEFKTPVGKRQVQFAQEGDLRFGQPPSPASAPADPDQ
jgi:LEA14-like dessication related protein